MKNKLETIIKEIEEDIIEIKKEMLDCDPIYFARKHRSIIYAQGMIRDFKEILKKEK